MPDGDKTRVTLELDAALMERAEKRGVDLSAIVERVLRRVAPIAPMTDQERADFIEDANARFERVGMASDDHIEP